ncbi:acyl-CoA/acyl-ACP dehydrogenase [Gordonia desulfuricans]|uniref:Acyl-CoA/acyl-ACP dehydrogenase n=1 Tax=Gordonia desulfuricans TaxID=89051 RepID=A0A7K3LUA9_9ACTN|nr:acyl-CoA dehydrogenase family protein [Gordonia desulfuricans]NDK91860.1 acyl-CoA/acyl-ACP dehydrogenase [Gordonia desulfuricans]
MDFALDAEAVAVGDVAADVFSRHQSQWESKFGREARDPDPAAVPGGFDDVLWQALGAAGLTSLALPAALGGDDLGVLAVLPLLRRMGESAGVAPVIGSLTSALVLAAVGADPADRQTAGPRDRWARTLTGGAWHAIALGEVGDPLTATPRTTLADGTLTGTKTGVLHADGATAFLVAADAGVVAVAADAPGITLTRTTTSSGWGEFTVTFDAVPVAADDLLTTDLSVLRDRYRIALCAYADGLVAGATRLTADHVCTREQFGKPIALFQAVGQQLADIYVIGRSMTLATTAAAWRISEGLDAQQDLGIGTYWLAAEIPATLRTMTHLHGGVGVDLTYPLHRYFSIAKDLARLAGGGQTRLDELAAGGHPTTDVAGAA